MTYPLAYLPKDAPFGSGQQVFRQSCVEILRYMDLSLHATRLVHHGGAGHVACQAGHGVARLGDNDFLAVGYALQERGEMSFSLVDNEF